MEQSRRPTRRDGGCHKGTMKFLYHTGPLADDRPTINIQQYDKFTPVELYEPRGSLVVKSWPTRYSITMVMDKLINKLNHAHDSLKAGKINSSDFITKWSVDNHENKRVIRQK